jgi:hypothetical protein
MLPEIPTFTPSTRHSTPLAVVVAVSLVSGFAGAFLLFWFFPGFRQARIPPGTQSVIVEGPGQVIVEESTRLRELREQNRPLVAALYRPGGGLTFGDTTIYSDDQLLGLAVILTADGWFATTADGHIKVGDVLLVRGQPYAIERLYADTASSFMMGKVAGERFTAVVFADEAARYTGMTLWTLGANNEVVKSVLRYDRLRLGAPERGPIISSDKLSLALALSAERGFTSGTPVFDLSGQLVGLTTSLADETSAVLPAEVLQSFMINVLKYGKPQRPFLGVEYVFDEAEAQDKSAGAIIYGGKSKSGIAAKSPAAKSGFRAGHLLVSIIGEMLKNDSSLFILLQQYSPGSRLIVAYERNGKKQETEVTLGELTP